MLLLLSTSLETDRFVWMGKQQEVAVSSAFDARGIAHRRAARARAQLSGTPSRQFPSSFNRFTIFCAKTARMICGLYERYDICCSCDTNSRCPHSTKLVSATGYRQTHAVSRCHTRSKWPLNDTSSTFVCRCVCQKLDGRKWSKFLMAKPTLHIFSAHAKTAAVWCVYATFSASGRSSGVHIIHARFGFVGFYERAWLIFSSCVQFYSRAVAPVGLFDVRA